MQENKENLRLFSNSKDSPRKPRRKHFTTPEKIRRNGYNDSTIIEENTFWHKQSDETFETLERMCNKTLSDPENSIHEYLASWDKKHSHDSKSDEEVLTLNKLFEEMGINEQDDSRLYNQTQLSEVEPPSCLWENTVNNESCMQPSPVKLIGHLRPSTILEESASDSIGSSSSYQSAQRIPETASSDQYETANDMQSRSKNVDSKETFGSRNSNSTDSGRSTTSRPDASAYFEMFPLRKIPYEDKPLEPKVYNKSIFLKGMKNRRDYEESLSSSNDTSRGFSSLSMDSLDRPRRRRSKSQKYFDDSLELASYEVKSPKVKARVKKELFNKMNKSKTVDDNDSSVIVVSDEESETTSSDDLNKGFMRGSSEPTDDSVISSEGSDLNVSHHFNDTLEEIEYIMKQGQKYLDEKKTSPPKMAATMKRRNTPISVAAVQTPKTNRTPSSAASPITPCTVIRRTKMNTGTQQSANKQMSPLHAKIMMKAKSAIRIDDRFDHIMSPIRAYIHNTPKSPITTKMKTTENIFESKYGRDSRPPSRMAGNREEIEAEPSPKIPCSLPRKAYVSADYRHIVDERSPMSIPGGDKIHRYLEIGMAPAVLKHEGKYKTTLTPRQKSDLDKSKGSLADFSLASGDMSVLLLKDAKHLASKY